MSPPQLRFFSYGFHIYGHIYGGKLPLDILGGAFYPSILIPPEGYCYNLNMRHVQSVFRSHQPSLHEGSSNLSWRPLRRRPHLTASESNFRLSKKHPSKPMEREERRLARRGTRATVGTSNAL